MNELKEWQAQPPLKRAFSWASQRCSGTFLNFYTEFNAQLTVEGRLRADLRCLSKKKKIILGRVASAPEMSHAYRNIKLGGAGNV